MIEISAVLAMTFLFSACSNESIEDAAVLTTQSDDTSVPNSITSDSLSDPAPKLSVEQQTYLDAINVKRAVAQDCGAYGIKPAVAPLQWNSSLANASAEHSNDMAQTEVFSHVGSGTIYDLAAIFYDLYIGSSFSQRMIYNGYISSYIGENIAAGQTNVESVVTAWINSDAHCRNIMDEGFNDMGMSLIKKSGTQYTTYWTLNLGKS